MHQPEKLATAMCSLVLAGCASTALDMVPSRPDRPWRPAISVGGEILANGAGGVATSDNGSYVLPSNPALAVVKPAPVLDPGRAYSLADLIDIAQSSHPATRIAWDDARHAALAAGIAESAYLPRLTANLVGARQSADGRSSLSSLNFGNGSDWGAVGALSLQWLLFDFGERAAVLDAAQQVTVASNIAFTAAHQRVIHDVCLAFYAQAAARMRVESADKSLSNALKVEAAADDRFKHGVGTVIAVAQARQATAQTRLAQVQSKGVAQDSYQALLSAMGISPMTQIRLADVSKRKLSPALAGSVDRLVREALSRRPDVLGAYAAQKAAAASIRAAEADFKPKVFVSASTSYTTAHLGLTSIPSVSQQPGTANLSGHKWGATVLAGITVPIYDGNMRNNTLQQAHANADKAAATLERVRDEAVRQIVMAQNALETSLAAHDAATALKTAAQTTFDAALDAYRHGVGSITDATMAETQLLQAGNAATDAYSNALSAAATLAFASGSLGAAPDSR
ncbi:TolC family protein [Variovorax rhizosphaerae]|uniref:Protein CyaE n=1 Tax=Variovorax rhizosphaerae TaxID=1836200 RepID=A0ABU8WDG4_9BURK